VDPLLTALLGLAAGAAIVGLIVLVTQRRELLQRFEALDRTRESDAKLFREEFSRNREEAGVAAKAQREELASTLKNVSDSTFRSLGRFPPSCWANSSR
jgi:hypothetical protein